MLEGAKSFVVGLVKGTGGHDLPQTFASVAAVEREEIVRSRAVRGAGGDAPQDIQASYVGLALSGGGIRSATFALGVLQGMQRLSVLRAVDYLSTVSGGGFVGSWWTAWLNRERASASFFPPEEQREPDRAPDFVKREEPPDGARFAGVDPIHHLRLFANYLTPRKGLLSSDTWRAVAVMSRNLILTWLVLVPMLCTVVLLGQLYFVAQPFDDQVAADFVHAAAAPGGPTTEATPDRALHEQFDGTMLWERVLAAARLPLALMLLMVWTTAMWMHFNNAGRWYVHLAVIVALLTLLGAAAVMYKPSLLAGTGGSGLRDHPWDVALLALTIVAAVGITVAIHHGADDTSPVTQQVKANRATRWQTRLLGAFTLIVLVLTFAGFAHEFLVTTVLNLAALDASGWKEKVTLVGTIVSVVSMIYTVVVSAPAGGRDVREMKPPSFASRLVLAVSPVLAMLLVGAAAALAMHWVMYEVLVVDRRLAPLELGAWASLGLAAFLAAWENEQIPAYASDTRVPRTYVVAVFLLLIVVVLAPLLPASISPERSAWVRAAAFVLAILAAIGVLWPAPRSPRVRAMLAFVVTFLLMWMIVRLPAFDDVWASGPDGDRAAALQIGLAVVAGFAGWTFALGWIADPNALSLHTFYRARLVRAYLGASNPNRLARGHDISEPDRDDDMPLARVRNGERGGPYPLINTTLNLVGGRDLVTAQRWAASFTLAPRYCGSSRTGYRPTEAYMGGALTLGAAVAASGAAVSPSMGSRTLSAALSLLLAAFNIRLGLWVPTPDRAAWTIPQTRLWPYYLLRESLSQTNDVGERCYITDGGHFDNSGVYSLIERGCRYIVLSDAGADPARCFADVGEVIRRCRIDFRAEIELDTQAFRPAGDGPGSVHVTCGRIRYDAEHLRGLGRTVAKEDDALGWLVWVRPAVLPGDAADVRQYRLENAQFPHQTTADQWFDESQFESYRKLGELSAEAAFGAATRTVPLAGQNVTSALVQRFFAAVTSAAAPSAPTSAH